MLIFFLKGLYFPSVVFRIIICFIYGFLISRNITPTVTDRNPVRYLKEMILKETSNRNLKNRNEGKGSKDPGKYRIQNGPLVFLSRLYRYMKTSPFLRYL